MPNLVMSTLAKRLQGYPSKAALAKDIGVSRQYIQQIVNGEKPASQKVLRFLGLSREVTIKQLNGVSHDKRTRSAKLKSKAPSPSPTDVSR